MNQNDRQRRMWLALQEVAKVTINWAVVGTGSHVIKRMAPALSRVKDVRLVAICSRDLDRAQQVADQFGFAKAYDSYERMLQDDSVDVVYICTPNALHAQQTIEAARAGKHVLVEKPMALSIAEAEAMIEECDAHGVCLGIGFHLRHHPAHQETFRLISDKAIGHLVLIQAHWIATSPRAEGWWQNPSMVGAYITMARGVHLMDLAFFLSGREPRKVTMMSDGQRADRELEDTTVATISLDNDIFVSLVASRLAGHTRNSFHVYGTEGWIRGDGTIGHAPTGTLDVTTSTSVVHMDFQAKCLLEAEVEAFNDAVLRGTSQTASGVDGLRVIRVTEALLESARSGRTIAL
ncbi:MAG: Gfo/Idh/MocA family protein [Chloroflexota bacterium]|jgi:1,5-anhydro-D-fructose reductase (1,5-anhydro-D-mannitol-forming)